MCLVTLEQLILQVGYRHIDTASQSRNERDVGRALHDSPHISRQEVWVSTKVWNDDSAHAFDNTVKAVDRSLEEMGLSYVDLCMLHAPAKGNRQDSWRALGELQKEGKVKSIGVQDFDIHKLQDLMSSPGGILPAVNQLEVTPFNTQERLCTFCREHNVQVEAYSPLTRGSKLKDPRLVEVADRYQRTPAQVLIRWGIQRGYVVVAKSTDPKRIRENADVYSFQLSSDDMLLLNSFGEGSSAR
eukprot:jgi/Chlat1/9009/Chrsp94S08349